MFLETVQKGGKKVDGIQFFKNIFEKLNTVIIGIEVDLVLF